MVSSGYQSQPPYCQRSPSKAIRGGCGDPIFEWVSRPDHPAGSCRRWHHWPPLGHQGFGALLGPQQQVRQQAFSPTARTISKPPPFRPRLRRFTARVASERQQVSGILPATRGQKRRRQRGETKADPPGQAQQAQGADRPGSGHQTSSSGEGCSAAGCWRCGSRWNKARVAC